MLRFAALPLMALLLVSPAWAGEEAATADHMSASCAPNDASALNMQLALNAPVGGTLTLALWGTGLQALREGKEVIFSATLPAANEGATLSYCPDDLSCTLVAGTLKVKSYMQDKTLQATLLWTDAAGQAHERDINATHTGNSAVCG